MADAFLTRRGRVVLAVCVAGAVMAVAAGGRSLNAVVLPGAVALAAGYVQISRVEPPGARRSGPGDGFVGEEREVRIDFDGGAPGTPVDRSFVADVRDRLDDGLADTSDSGGVDGRTGAVRIAVGEEPATYRLGFLERGDRRLGPIELSATDVFGLFERRLRIDERDRVVVYPAIRAIPSWFRRGLYADEALGASRQREEFDRLREYARGDSLRDVHWPATAKHDEIVVKEFAAETDHRRVSIAGGTRYSADADAADVLASATASLALSLLDDGVPVDVRLPAGAVAAEPGPHGRRELLELAAHTGPGAIDDLDDADVRIVAGRDDARIRTEDRTVRFSELRAAANAPGAGERDGGRRDVDRRKWGGDPDATVVDGAYGSSAHGASERRGNDSPVIAPGRTDGAGDWRRPGR
ncbi:Protein of unknown function DUF58 [Halorubrum aquaticum]|uniref:DUF58 domain-containing protein n=1 Tax=Halorubrum aquaticum TaxID=387340 RepID=A0A1I3BPG1_9EURY|nr:DUF58 domain-containing protein [Halorubrum aquaticum]SFH63809.1 Protein of unknown function DUF58 [Halorubrum aquaticum]